MFVFCVYDVHDIDDASNLKMFHLKVVYATDK